MMTTVLRKHTKQYHHKSRFTRYLRYFRDVGPSHIVTNCTLDFANSTLGFARAFGENSKLGGGKLVLKIFARYLKYLGHVVVHCCPPFFSSIVASGGGGGLHDDVQAASQTPRTTSKTNQVWALRVLASLSHVQLASLFLMFRRCCASGFGSV